MTEHTFRVRYDGEMAAVTITDIGGDGLADDIRAVVEREFGDG